VGVLFDYFRAPDASTAATVLERVRGPTTPDPDAPVLDTVAGKGFEPEVMMLTLQSLLTGVPYEELPEGELLAMEGEDGPWIVQLSEELRDALADAQLRRLPVIAERWVRTEEFWDQATRPRCCRSWARSLPWPVVPGRPVSACTAGSACSRLNSTTTRGCCPAWSAWAALLGQVVRLGVRLGAGVAGC
jgi:hypothetical protein